ncbi:hypothetical protein [Streptomyces avicenniae]|uniref:hypothetical protein n=1 Tax=Streptomyces avicenniae TaxID=500153 RepID=UPI00069B2A13|nr:hypothetical protein [Streptomyces avicenniae]
MNDDIPPVPGVPDGAGIAVGVAERVLSARQLRERGVTAAVAQRLCRPGGPWQMPLPGVFLLHAGPPTGEETVRAALCYAGGRPGEAVVTGLAALALHGFTAVPPSSATERVDVLVPRTRRLRSAGRARLIRTSALPRAVVVGGFPVAPVARALADAIAHLPGTPEVRRLLGEAVRGGHCEPRAVVRELAWAGLLGRPVVAEAVRTLPAEGRAAAEGRLLETVRAAGLPDPCWNVALWLPDGPFLGTVDAYWPRPAVAVRIDAWRPGPVPGPELDPERRARDLRLHQTLVGLGVGVVRLTPRGLRDAPERQAAVLADALRAAERRPPATYVVVMPR